MGLVHEGTNESASLVGRVRGHHLDLAGRHGDAGDRHRLAQQGCRRHHTVAIGDHHHGVEAFIRVGGDQSQILCIGLVAAIGQQRPDLIEVGVHGRPQRESVGRLHRPERSASAQAETPAAPTERSCVRMASAQESRSPRVTDAAALAKLSCAIDDVGITWTWVWGTS